MSRLTEFDDLNVLIPGYSVEDLPTDLEEDAAASLLNAFSVAWHPLLLIRVPGLPLFRHADSFHQMSGRQILIVPSSTDGWLPHDWRQDASRQNWAVLSGCSDRSEYLDQIRQSLPSHDPDSSPVLVDEFLAFGTTFLLTRLLSRRMHHFVDPDEILLSREIHLAAAASLSGDTDQTALHLKACFEQLRETRERFYPLNCYLVDLCVPSSRNSPQEIVDCIKASPNLSLVASTRQLHDWCSPKPTSSSPDSSANTPVAHAPANASGVIRDAVDSGTLCLLTGHSREVRTVLGSLSALVDDLQAGREELISSLGISPRHWARRRFGLITSLPMVLKHFGFQSAFHVALDDGLYPDKERSQFDWMSGSGDHVSATSRIPVAIDSASSVLRLADRYNESMQDDTVASLLLARMPTLTSPWLNDLRITAKFAPVLGEFVSLESFFHLCSAYRTSLRFEEGEYLSPALIQSSVLRLEAPVSGPAQLNELHFQLDRCAAVLSTARILKCSIPESCQQELRLIRDLLLDQEDKQCEPGDPDENRISELCAECQALGERIAVQLKTLAKIVADRISKPADGSRALAILNLLPFSRTSLIQWPTSWNLPANSDQIECLAAEHGRTQALVKLPPGGFTWLRESNTGNSPHSVLQKSRRDLPIAQDFVLQNHFLTISFNERTGGIASVSLKNTRANRFSQMVTFRYEREQVIFSDGQPAEKTHYAVPQLQKFRVVDNGLMTGAVETVIDLISPSDQKVIATCRQVVSIDRLRPLIQIELFFDEVIELPRGNPWLTYYGCRFAWENESAAVTRSVLGQAAGFTGERCESADYLEVSDDASRLLIVPYGRPWHRLSGPRMMDSLLIVENETQRSFRFVVDLDQEFPMRTVLDARSQPVVCEVPGRFPEKVSSAWLLGITARNVIIARTESTDSEDNTALLVRFWLLETEGLSTDCMIRTARRPESAGLVNGENRSIRELPVDDQGVTVKMDRFELKVVCLRFPKSP
ncbi:MAG: hypothetical protein JNL58_09440 [Planctomyces sp.]|nr:hypothetical protein [Planctomyces sp.]